MEIAGFENITLSQKIADSIALQIGEGVLVPGQRLLEQELTDHFGTSRAPIREALYILEREGIVERIPRRGVFVKKYTQKELTDLYDTIYRLEEIAFEKLLQHVQDKEIKEIIKIVERMEQETKSKHLKEYFDLVDEFHQKFFGLSGNEILKELFFMLIKRVKHLRYMSISYQSNIEFSLQEYKGIVVGLLNRDLQMIKRQLQLKEKRAVSVLAKIVVQEQLVDLGNK
ncbi:GntR family transcriptional regulator [Paenibacillus frigoriresistens]|uniref:GntR family transcriptional regulator n=1 Tax=Paenibacillus alginolyticus TaxID=59839 RepID=UPI001567C24D|nr:GntR family transcriptional regulator [Paenibacillus frigoriresistens]NRF94373.1 GntR family transcriptional regulator [Paenibacillus frigoriresistens]